MSITHLPRICAGLMLAAVAALTAPGCAVIDVMSANRPVDDSHMSHAIAAIAPIGTPRDQTIQRLNAAGIQGDFINSVGHVVDGKMSMSEVDVTLRDSLYEAQSWKRPNGEDWLIDVLLTFDTAGRLESITSQPNFGHVPPSTRLVRRRWRPDGQGLAFQQLGNDGDVPRLLQLTSTAANTPGVATTQSASTAESSEFLPPKIAIGISDSPNAFDNLR